MRRPVLKLWHNRVCNYIQHLQRTEDTRVYPTCWRNDVIAISILRIVGHADVAVYVQPETGVDDLESLTKAGTS